MDNRQPMYRAAGFGAFAGLGAIVPLHLALNADPGVAVVLVIAAALLLALTVRGFRHQPAPGSREGTVTPGATATAIFGGAIALVIATGAAYPPGALASAVRPEKAVAKAAQDYVEEVPEGYDADAQLDDLFARALEDNSDAMSSVVSVEIRDWTARLSVYDYGDELLRSYEINDFGETSVSAVGVSAGQVRTFSWSAVLIADLSDAWNNALATYAPDWGSEAWEAPTLRIEAVGNAAPPRLTVTVPLSNDSTVVRTIDMRPDGTLPRQFDPTDPAAVLDEAMSILAEQDAPSSSVVELIYQAEGESGLIDPVSLSPLEDRAGLLVTVAGDGEPTAYVAPLGRFPTAEPRPPGGLPTFDLASVAPEDLASIIFTHAQGFSAAPDEAATLAVRVAMRDVDGVPTLTVEIQFSALPDSRALYTIDGIRVDG